MRKLGIVLVPLLVLALTIGCGQVTPTPPGSDEASSNGKSLSSTDVVAKVSPSVVYIEADYGRWYGSGTGIIIDSAGFVITNNHVVEQGYYATVYLHNGYAVEAEIVYRDKNRDIAILECPDGEYSAVVLGSTETPNLGEDVIAMGFPSASVLGDSPSVSKGIISAFRTIDGVKYIQTDASLNPGSSGGPLINLSGEVIGINTYKLTESEGIYFAIDLSGVNKSISSILQQLDWGQQYITKPPTEKAEVPTEGVVLEYHGKGCTQTSLFSIDSNSSPWKLYFRPEWDGRPSLWVNEVSDIIDQPDKWRGGIGTQNAMHLDVTACRTYETYVYSLTGSSLALGVGYGAPADGEWTVWVVEEPVSVASLPFPCIGEGEVNTPPFLLEESREYRVNITPSWDGDISFGVRDIENELVTFTKPRDVQPGFTYGWTFTWKRPTEGAYLHIEHAPPISRWTVSISEVT